MKKFDPEKELAKVKKENKRRMHPSRLSNAYIPILVVACSCLAMSAVTFSSKIVEDEANKYTIKIDIVNGEQDVYLKNVREGAFQTTIIGKGTFGSLDCTSGHLDYDVFTQMISSKYINQDTTCVLTFLDSEMKNLSVSQLGKINDNTGISYYYKADAMDNYVKFQDMLFRIVRINGDGTIRLLFNDVVLSSSFGDGNDYGSSLLKTTLERWYQTTFTNDDFLVEGDFDTTNYTEVGALDLINFEGYTVSKVGTLSVREVELLTKDLSEADYLDTISGMYLLNGNGADSVYMYKNKEIGVVSPDNVLAVRPVIHIKGTLVGDGTIENPYTVE